MTAAQFGCTRDVNASNGVGSAAAVTNGAADAGGSAAAAEASGVAGWGATLSRLRTLGFTPSEISEIAALLGAVLLTSNLEVAAPAATSPATSPSRSHTNGVASGAGASAGGAVAAAGGGEGGEGAVRFVDETLLDRISALLQLPTAALRASLLSRPVAQRLAPSCAVPHSAAQARRAA